METQRKRAVIVGIFVLVGLMILIAAVFTLGGQKNLFKDSFSIRAKFDDVGGLQKGSNVWYSGLKVGIVKELGFNEQGLVEVVMNIDENSRKMIRRNMKAKVGSDGLIGNKIVVIYGGDQKAPQVQEGDVLAVEKALSTDDMLATLQENNKNILEITTDFRTISDRLVAGEGSIGKLLRDESLANDLQAAVGSIRMASIQANRLTQSLSGYAARLNTPGSLTNDLVSDTVVFARLRATARQMDELTKTANAVVENLNQTSRSIQSGIENKNSPAGVLLNDETTAAELKLMMHNLQAGTRKLEENLEALQHHFLLRGFFKKRAKEREKEEERQKENVEVHAAKSEQ